MNNHVKFKGIIKKASLRKCLNRNCQHAEILTDPSFQLKSYINFHPPKSLLTFKTSCLIARMNPEEGQDNLVQKQCLLWSKGGSIPADKLWKEKEQEKEKVKESSLASSVVYNLATLWWYLTLMFKSL